MMHGLIFSPMPRHVATLHQPHSSQAGGPQKPPIQSGQHVGVPLLPSCPQHIATPARNEKPSMQAPASVDAMAVGGREDPPWTGQ